MKKLEVSTNIDFEIKSKRTKNILLICLSIIILFFVTYPLFVFLASKSPVKTQTAINQTIYRSIETKGFVLRNENYVNNPHSGTVVPAVVNGSKVACGDTVANIYADESSALNAARLRELKDELDYFRGVSLMTPGSAISDIDIYKNNVTDGLFNIIESLQKHDYTDIYNESRRLREAITKQQIAVGETVNVSERMTSLQTEYDSLKNSAVPRASVTAPATGYYVNFSDGYENVYPYEDIKNISGKDIDNILNTSPSPLPGGNVGKQITDFNWYLVCKATALELGNIGVGDTVTVLFMNSAVEQLSMKVVSINQTDGEDELAIVLKSNEMNRNIAALRIENIKIRVERFDGLNVDKLALRTVEGQTGVYIKLGNIIKFRKINIVYSDENFILSCKPKDIEDDGYLKQYDDIIVEGTDLYDGKIID